MTSFASQWFPPSLVDEFTGTINEFLQASINFERTVCLSDPNGIIVRVPAATIENGSMQLPLVDTIRTKNLSRAVRRMTLLTFHAVGDKHGRAHIVPRLTPTFRAYLKQHPRAFVGTTTHLR